MSNQLYADGTSYGATNGSFGSGTSTYSSSPASAIGTMNSSSLGGPASAGSAANTSSLNNPFVIGSDGSVATVTGADIQPALPNPSNPNNKSNMGKTGFIGNLTNPKLGNPLVLDEFQNSLRIRTGLILNHYGYSFFIDPITFTPVHDAPASSNYVLGPGDTVSIKGWGSVDIAYTSEVDNAGNIFIPKVGQINLTGVRVADLNAYLKERIGRIYRNFSLSANVSQVRSIQIVVAGFANKPGTYTISSLSTLTNAVFASGGPSPDGSLRHIELKRGGRVVADYDMYDLLLSGNSAGDVRLLSGDVIYIKPHGREVAIYDGVKVPGIYETKDKETVADVVKFAGGYTFNNTKKQLIIETMDENKQINVTNFNFAEGMLQSLSNGEIIHFFKAPNSYKDAVVLIGNVANPSRFNWHQGLTIKDIITNKEQLLTKTFWNSYSANSYAKDNILDIFAVEKTSNWSAKDQTSSQFTSGLGSGGDTTAGQQMSPFAGGDNLFTAGPVSIPEADINWHYAVVVRINPDNFHSELIPFDLSLAIAGESQNNLILYPGDIINVLSSKDVRGPTKKGMLYVFVDGEVNTPGVYEMKPGSKLLDAINMAGNITSDAYVYGMELDRDAVKKRQRAALNQMLDNVQQSLLAQANNSVASSLNGASMTQQVLVQQQAFIDKLRKLQPTGRVVFNLKNNQITLADLPNVTLENGDTIYIPPTPSTVDVIGQVYNPATFIYNNGFSLSDYLDAAGTPNQFADTSSIYVLHADGTLYSKQQAGWFGVFGSKHLYAGDAIVVPQTIQFMSLQQNLINWTQVLANFGLGVAAINQLGN